jgi:hypothetical protein
VDIPFTGSQSWNDVFLTAVGENSTLLFMDTSGFPYDRGTGVHAQPPGGGSHRADGARFAHIVGRPYRMNHDALRANVEYILESFFLEPYGQVGVTSGTTPVPLALEPGFPNPFNPHVTIPFVLPADGVVDLSIYDVGGRLVRTLVEGQQSAGKQSVAWLGVDAAGRPVSSGVYFVRLKTDAETLVRPLVLTR